MKNKFIQMAVELSEKNIEENKGGPFGAVVVLNDEVIGIGTNLVTSTNDPTAHAEIVAIRNACKNIGNFSLKGAELYTSCEPCPMCLAAIYWARMEKIFYANDRYDAAEIDFDDSYIYDEISLPVEKRSIKMIKINENKAKIVFNNWKNKQGKIKY